MFKIFIVFSWDQDNFKIEWSRPVVSEELWQDIWIGIRIEVEKKTTKKKKIRKILWK